MTSLILWLWAPLLLIIVIGFALYINRHVWLGRRLEHRHPAE